MNEIIIDSPEEKKAFADLEKRKDAEADRMRRFLDLPDLSRTPGSPIHELVSRITGLAEFKDYAVVKVPEIVPAVQSFDLFDFPADHPARSKSDTYYVTDSTHSTSSGQASSPQAAQILRTHTTVSWYYYLTSAEAKKKIAANEPLGVLTFGKVYRKDEIDRRHMNIFHQMDGYYIQPKAMGVITVEHLKEILVKIAQAVFGAQVKYNFKDDNFPYTNPSLEMNVECNGQWVEILGSGIVKDSVLEKLDVDPKNYTGWAFGIGLERLAIASIELPDIRLLWSHDERVKRQLKLGNKYKEVSKYPPITRDISFVVPKSFVPNNYFDLIRDIGAELVEEVTLLDKYENAEKFGADKMSYTYRIIYRSTERTLAIGEIEPIQNKVIEETEKQFKAEVR